ncbi:MAG: protein kinase, partial [Gemmatimonadales bacterium]
VLRDVVDALAHAHEQGVVHRDIKPDNVMLSGRHALVMDFGVAKAVSEATGRQVLTTAGVAVGTPAYMAPEQATADPNTDHRADIYAVGAVGYELLTGRPPFTGTSPQMILSAHVTEPVVPVTKHRQHVSAVLNDLILKCLEKHPADRWQTAEELLPHLEALATPSGGITPTDTAPITAARPARRKPAATATVAAIAAALVLVGVGAGVLLMNRGPEPITVGRTTQLTLEPGLELDPAISPDGRMVAYAAGASGRMHIHLRQARGGRSIDLTEELAGDHRWPQWSPDGNQILFHAEGAIYVTPALVGTPKRLIGPFPGGAEGAVGAFSAAWSPDGRRIVYAVGNGIYFASLDGGEPERIGEEFEPHSFQWSQDGSRIAYVAGNPLYVFGTVSIGNIAPSRLRTLALSDGGFTDLTDKEHVYVSPVWLSRDNQLLYVSNEGGARDVYQLPLSSSGGPARPPIRLTTGLDVLTMSLSADGSTLAYSVFRYDANVWSVRVPRRGSISVGEAQPVTEGNQAIEGIGVSSDGRWLAFDSNRSGNQDIYRLALPDGEPEQLTSHPAADFYPSWSPDDQEIAFYSFREGSRDLYLMDADGGSLRRLSDDPTQERYPDWSPDGNRLVFQSDKTGNQEIYVMSRESRSSDWSVPRQLTFDGGTGPLWSPDDRWIAYVGERGLRVVSPEGGDPRTLVESDGREGRPAPVFAGWSSDGTQVYYKASGAEGTASFWAVPVSG